MGNFSRGENAAGRGKIREKILLSTFYRVYAKTVDY